jgi:FKBP-type peptidyl-prolyl cis-trans isomerase FkpA
MKRTVAILFACLFTFFLSGCVKQSEGCKSVSPQSEESAILSYAAANGITPTKHSSGLYYQILAEGTGTAPVSSSVVGITYSGKTTNNAVFDQTTTQKDWPLDRLIVGWQIGLPLIKEGGNIILLVPSAMAYGCESPAPEIPANSILVFNINLIDVK